MRVRINEIPDEGLTLTEKLSSAELKLDTPELRFIEPLRVTATFHTVSKAVWVEVGVQGRQERICGRCGEPYPAQCREDFQLDYPAKEKLDLDVTDDIRQEILLAYPAQFLCREDCLGLCPRCGADRNQGPCGCS